MSAASDKDALELPERYRKTKDSDGLTLKQRRFVEAYMGEAKGNGTLAATMAGYNANYEAMQAIASENLRKPAIAKFIKEQTENDPLVASRIDRQRMLTEIMNNSEEATKDRLKALELLAKMQADFIERKEVVADVAIEHEHRPALDLSKLSDEELKQLEGLMQRI